MDRADSRANSSDMKNLHCSAGRLIRRFHRTDRPAVNKYYQGRKSPVDNWFRLTAGQFSRLRGPAAQKCSLNDQGCSWKYAANFVLATCSLGSGLEAAGLPLTPIGELCRCCAFSFGAPVRRATVIAGEHLSPEADGRRLPLAWFFDLQQRRWQHPPHSASFLGLRSSTCSALPHVCSP